MIRRISLYGGPGSRKSTIASYIFSKLKEENYNIELVSEVVKLWTYIGRKPIRYDQIYLFGNQFQREYEPLNGGFDLVISDSPLLLTCYYTSQLNKDNPIIVDSLVNISMAFEKDFPGIHIFLNRNREDDGSYNQVGRFHTFEEALKLDKEILDFTKDILKNKLIEVNICEKEVVYNIVKEKLRKNR
jgi:hypothetical protein